MVVGWELGAQYNHTGTNSQKFCVNGNLAVRVDHLCYVQGMVSVLVDWVLSHTHTMLDNLGQATVRVVAWVASTISVIPDVYQSGLTIETGSYCLHAELYKQCYVPETRNSKGSFQAPVISGCRLQDSRLYMEWQSL